MSSVIFVRLSTILLCVLVALLWVIECRPAVLDHVPGNKVFFQYNDMFYLKHLSACPAFCPLYIIDD